MWRRECRTLEDLPEPLQACARGALPANVALMQMVQAAQTRDDLEADIDVAIALSEQADERAMRQRLQAIRKLWRETPAAWDTLRTVLSLVAKPHQPEHPSIDRWAAIFDEVCAVSPEAGVALYSLGRTDLLDAATAEIVAYMRDRGLLGADKAALEIGCGNGRFLKPLGNELRLMVGIDISMGMLRQARQRCAGSTGVALMRGSGRDLAAFADEGFDLVCAVDSFPYLVDAGVAARHIEDAARLLKPGGALLIVNYSYRADRSADRKELLRLVVSTGLEPVCDSAVQFRHWDGVVFQFLKRSK